MRHYFIGAHSFGSVCYLRRIWKFGHIDSGNFLLNNSLTENGRIFRLKSWVWFKFKTKNISDLFSLLGRRVSPLLDKNSNKERRHNLKFGNEDLKIYFKKQFTVHTAGMKSFYKSLQKASRFSQENEANGRKVCRFSQTSRLSQQGKRMKKLRKNTKKSKK